MRETADTWYVFGWSWWPFDGSVTAAVIALIGTAITIGFNWRKFHVAEKSQNKRHKQTIKSTTSLGGREQLLIDLRRAEDALAGTDHYQWIYAGVLLKHVGKSSYAETEDKKRARQIIKIHAARIHPSAPAGGVS